MNSTDQRPVSDVVVDDRDSLDDVLDRLWLLAGRTVRLAIPVDTSLFLTATEFRILKDVAGRRDLALMIETEDPLRIQLAGLFDLAAARVGAPLGPRRMPDPQAAEPTPIAGPRLIAAPASQNGHHEASPPSSGLAELPGARADDDRPPIGTHPAAPWRPEPREDGPRFREPGQPFTVRSIDDRPALATPGRVDAPPLPPPPMRPGPAPVVAPAPVAPNGTPAVRLMVTPPAKPPATVLPLPGGGSDELRAAVRRRAGRAQPTANGRLALMIGGAAAVVLVLAAVAVFVVLPRATVTLDLNEQTIVAEAPFLVLPPGEAAPAGVLAAPGESMSVEVAYTATVETTGWARVGETAATGTILLANPTEDSVTIPAGTVGVGDTGAEFRFVNGVTVPPGNGAVGQTEAVVEAVAPGSVGNLGVGELSGVLDSGVYFSNRVALIEGGTDREERGVAQADLDGLTARFDGELAALALASFAETLPVGTTVVEGSLAFGEPTLDFDRAVGEVGDSVTLTATVEVRGLSYRVNEVMAAAEPLLRADLNARVPDGYDLDPAAVTISRPVSAAAGDSSDATVTVTASGRAVHRFGEKERAALAERLKGADADEAAEILRSVPAVNDVDIDYFPGVVGERMPRQADRIEIVIRD